MDPLGLLFLLFLFSRRNGSSSSLPSWGSHASHPTTGPAAFPPVPTGTVAPAPSPSVQAGARWVPYVPLNQAVIARAEQLLHDRSMHVNQEVIEPDPASGGQMRYLKVNAPKGHISVTAWKPTLASPAPGAGPSAATPTVIPNVGPAPHGVPAAYHPTSSPAAAPTLAPAPSSSGRTLRRGMSGPDVAQWQSFLGLPADGKFGPKTETETKLFQRSKGLTPDGIVGRQTRSAAHLAAA